MIAAKAMLWHKVEDDFNFVAEIEGNVDPSGVLHILLSTEGLQALSKLLEDSLSIIPAVDASSLAVIDVASESTLPVKRKRTPKKKETLDESEST